MRGVLCLGLLLAIATSSPANEKEVAQQKASIAENLKLMNLKAAPLVETSDLLIVTTFPVAKVKPMSESAQKAFAIARENLGYGADSPPFTGKLTVYAFAELAEFKSFLRKIEQRQPKQDTRFDFNTAGNTPYLVIAPEAGAQEAEFPSRVAALASAALLHRKVAVKESSMPDWMLIGYGRACLLRSEPNTKQSTVRTKLKTLVKGKAPPLVKDLWMSKSMAERDLVAGSVMEYLAFTGNDKFLAFARMASQPGEDEDKPNIVAALQSLDFTPETLDFAWKTWVVKGK